MRVGLFAPTLLLLATSVAACHDKPRDFTPEVRVTRIEAVRRDAAGRALTMDVEVSYDDCPGTQIEVIRGGAEFAACFAKHRPGQRVPAKVHWYFHQDGTYHWEIHELGGCARPPDPNDEASFEAVRECADLLVNGVKVGFRCNEIPQKHLLDKCPWFRRE